MSNSKVFFNQRTAQPDPLTDSSLLTFVSVLQDLSEQQECGQTVALTLVGSNLTWIKDQNAKAPYSLPTDGAFAELVPTDEEPLVILNTGDSALKSSAWVTSGPKLQYCALIQLKDSSNQNLGWLGVGAPQKRSAISNEQRVSLKLLQQTAAKLVGVYATVRDASMQMTNMMEHQSSGLMTTNQDGKINYVNSLFFSILGLKPSLSQHRQGIDLTGSEDSRIANTELFRKYVKDAFNNRDSAFKREFQTVDDGVIEIEITPVRIRSQFDGHLVTLRDLSDLRSSESLIEFQRLQIIESQRLSALGEMASGMAHEINNPMAIIYGRAIHLLELSQQGTVSKAQIESHTQHIVDVSERVMKIISGLRSFSRNGEKDPIRAELITDIVEGTLAFCTQRLKADGIELRLSLGTEPMKIQCRPVQVSQILLNLINNAVDAIAHLPEKWIEVEAIQVFQEVLIAVMDSGPGINADLQEKIFNPFFTTKLEQKGTGLGLSISQNMARSQGGDLQLDPTSRHTRFVLRMPGETMRLNVGERE